MEDEYKEIKIKGYTFRIRKDRSFKDACDFEKIKFMRARSNQPVTADDYIRADCKYKVLDRDDNGKVSGHRYIEIPDDVFDDLNVEEGRILFHEVVSYRGLFKKKVKKKKTSELQSGEQKEESKAKQDSASKKLKK